MPYKQQSYTLKVEKLTDYFDVDDGQREVPVNMTLNAEGFLTKDTGIEAFSGAFADPILWIKNFKKKNGNQYKLLASGTKLYFWDFTKNKAYPLPASQAGITGTVSVVQGSTTVTGSGTNFVADLVVGDIIVINGEYFEVAVINNGTNLTVDTNCLQVSASGLTLNKNTTKLFTTGGLFGGIEYNDELFFGNAIDDYCKFDGTVITGYGSLPKGNIFEVFEDRIFVSGVTAEPLSVYYSDVGVPTTFTVTSVIKPLGTDKVTGLSNYYSTLMIFKLGTVWKLTFIYDQVASAFLPKLELVNKNYGCVGFRAYCWVENDIWFFTGKELRAVGFRDQQTGVLGLDPSVLSNDIKETLRIVNTSLADKVVVFYYDRKFYLVISLQAENDTIFVSHLLYKNAWTKIKNRKKSRVRQFEVRNNEVYFSSSDVNRVYKWNSSYSDAGDAISCYVNFKEYEDKDFSQTNIFRYLDLKFKNLQTKVQINVWNDDFDIRSRKAKTFFVGTDAEGQENSLGEVPMGEQLVADAYGEDVASSNFVKRRVSHLVKGTVYQFGCANDILNDSFTIAGWEITGYRRPRRYYSHGKVISM